MCAHVVQRRVVPPVASFDRIVAEIVEFPLIVERIAAVHGSAHTVGGQMPHSGLGPRGRVVERADQFPQMRRAARGGVLPDADHEAFEVGRGVCGYPDTQRRRNLRCQPQHPGDTRGAGVAFEHVVAGHQIHGPVLVGRGAVDHRHQVASRERMDLGEGLGERRRCGGHVDPGGGQQGGDQVHV